jgi:hypothetical protein
MDKPLRAGVVPNLIAAKDRGRVQGVNPAKLVCAGKRSRVNHKDDVGSVQSKH